MPNVYDSAVDPSGRYGVVFEADDQSAYLYLLDMRKTTKKIVEAFNAGESVPSPAPSATVRWGSSGKVAGLFVGDEIVALFDVDRLAAGGGPCGRWAKPDDVDAFPSSA